MHVSSLLIYPWNSTCISVLCYEDLQKINFNSLHQCKQIQNIKSFSFCCWLLWITRINSSTYSVCFLTGCRLENIIACIQQFLMNSYQISRNTLHYWWTKWQTSLTVFPMRHSYKSPMEILLYRKNCFIRN